MVPLHVIDHLIYAPVRIPGASGLAQLDTGATRSYIYFEFAHGFARTGSAKIGGALGSASVERCTVPRLEFDGQPFESVSMDVNPGAAANLQEPLLLTLGADILYSRPFCVDLAGREAGFVNKVAPRALEPVAAVRMDRGLAFFTLQIAGVQLRALFDTGAGYSVLNARRLGDVSNRVEDLGYEEATDPTGATQQVPLYRAEAPAVGERILPAVQFLVIDLGPVEDVLGAPLDFVFGVEAMRGSTWMVDPASSVLWMGLASG